MQLGNDVQFFFLSFIIFLFFYHLFTEFPSHLIRNKPLLEKKDDNATPKQYTVQFSPNFHISFHISLFLFFIVCFLDFCHTKLETKLCQKEKMQLNNDIQFFFSYPPYFFSFFSFFIICFLNFRHTYPETKLYLKRERNMKEYNDIQLFFSLIYYIAFFFVFFFFIICFLDFCHT